MDFQEAASHFLAYLRVERGLATNSINAYGRDLAVFGLFLDEKNLTITDVQESVVTDFQNFLRNKNLASSTVQRNLSALRSFYAYLGQENGIANPTTDLEKGKLVRKLPKALSIAEVISLIDGAFHESKPITLRDRALIELLYGTGARISEIVALDLSDIHVVHSDGDLIETIKLRGKGAKERIVPLGSFARKSLQEYIVRIRPDLALKSHPTSPALFLNNRGTRLSRQSGWQFVADSARAVGLEGKVSPHVFRHSYATHLLDGGADIRVVQELLGHASVTTTQIYTLITIDKVRESYSSAHPRARD